MTPILTLKIYDMAYSTSNSQTKYFILNEEAVKISCGSQKYAFSRDEIKKIHISKKKPSYFSAIIGNLLSIPETGYYLCVQTNDERDIKIPINPLQRYYFIRLISALRHSKTAKQQAYA